MFPDSSQESCETSNILKTIAVLLLVFVLSEGFRVIFAVTNQLSIANWTVLPCVQLAVLVVHQEEGGAVSIDQLLGLVHDLQDQSVHADHLLEYRPGNRNQVESTLKSLHLLDHIEKEVRGLSLPADPAVLMDEVEADLNPGEGGLQLTSDP